MAKKGPLGKAEKFYIEENCFKKDAKIIAQELDRSLTSIEEHINHFKLMKTKAGGKFARHGDPEKGGAVVSTQAASERSDDFRKEPRKNRRQQNCTMKIREDS